MSEERAEQAMKACPLMSSLSQTLNTQLTALKGQPVIEEVLKTAPCLKEGCELFNETTARCGLVG